MADNPLTDAPIIRPRPMDADDTLIVEFRSSTRAWLFQSGSGWALLAFAGVVTGLGIAFGYGAEAFLGAMVVSALIILRIYLGYRFSLYWLDGSRLFMRRGIMVRSEEEVELYRIKDVRVTFSLVQQMFDNGNIMITSSDLSGAFGRAPTEGGRAVITIRNVMAARQIRGELRDRVETIRERRGVRELDIN